MSLHFVPLGSNDDVASVDSDQDAGARPLGKKKGSVGLYLLCYLPHFSYPSPTSHFAINDVTRLAVDRHPDSVDSDQDQDAAARLLSKKKKGSAGLDLLCFLPRFSYPPPTSHIAINDVTRLAVDRQPGSVDSDQDQDQDAAARLHSKKKKSSAGLDLLCFLPHFSYPHPTPHFAIHDVTRLAIDRQPAKTLASKKSKRTRSGWLCLLSLLCCQLMIVSSFLMRFPLFRLRV